MMNLLSRFIPRHLRDRYRSNYMKKNRNSIIGEWKSSGNPIPVPHAVKQLMIERYQRLSGYEVLVETGTFLGDMVEAQRENFSKIYSVELGPRLWKNAVQRFKKFNHINIIQGDSGKVLDQVTALLNQPAIFWLDGHYSAGVTARGEKDCPIYGEVDAIFRHQRLPHILLIDDARLFVGQGDYPTIEELTQYVKSKDPVTAFR
jgi:hypothetical protein